jgi:hypothetical protein
LKNRIRLLAGVAGLAAAALIVPLQASASTAGAAVFAAPTSFVNPPVPALGSGVLATGAYAFDSHNGLGVCDGVSTDPGAGACHIVSNGNYTNVQCGTGLAAGNATVSGSVNASGSYTIVFVSGVGAILPTGVTPTLTGAVVIAPTVGNCATSAVSQFTAVGASVGTNP